MVRVYRVGALAMVGALAACGGTATRGAQTIEKIDHPAPPSIVNELRHTYEPIEPCPHPCPRVLKRAHDHVLLLHRSTALAPGTVPHAVAQSTLAHGETVTFYLYRSRTGQLCDDVSVDSGVEPLTGALTPGLPCVPHRPCGPICLTQLHCCGVNLIVGTVTTRAQELRATFDDDGSPARLRLDGLVVPGVPTRRFVVFDIRPHDFVDPVRLLAGGKQIAVGSVGGVG